MKTSNCPVCGFGLLNESYKTTQELRWSYDICPCCGCEFGYDDNEEYYKNWIKNGCECFNKKIKPDGWKLESQKQYQIRPWPPE